MALSLFTRSSAVPPDTTTWTPTGTTVVQRYRGAAGERDGAIVLVYTADTDQEPSSFAAACLGCSYRVMRNRHDTAWLSENQAADFANTHAASCRALDRGIPAPPSDDQAVKIVRDRLYGLRPYGTTSPEYVFLRSFHADRVALQRPAGFINGMMLQLTQSEPDFLTAQPHSSGHGLQFLVQPHPLQD